MLFIYMNFKRLLHTDLGQTLISILLGIGLASLFRKACTDKNCIRFNGPVITDIKDKIFKHDGKCYKYKSESSTCDATKRIINVSEQMDPETN